MSPLETERLESHLIQVIVFVVLGARRADFDGQALVRQLIHPDSVRDRDRSGHRAALVLGFGRNCRLSAKFPAGVDEAVENLFVVKHKDNAEFITPIPSPA